MDVHERSFAIWGVKEHLPDRNGGPPRLANVDSLALAVGKRSVGVVIIEGIKNIIAHL